jgi:hypothetical protein
MLLLLVLVARTASANPDCTCANLKEIQYRMQEINALIAGYKAEIARLGQSSPPFSEAAYNAFEHGTQQVTLDNMKSANPGSPHTAGGYTGPASCDSHFPDNLSKCLADALHAHESHHASVCSGIKGQHPNTTPLTDYREKMLLADAYQEEIVSYYLELDVLGQAYRDLPDTCKPKSWFLKWDLTISGKSDQTSKIKWAVKHEYSGAVELSDVGVVMGAMPRLTPQQAKAMTPAQAMAMVKNAKKVHMWLYKAPTMFGAIDVTIDDSVKRKNHDRGEGESFENTTTTNTWKGTTKDQVQNSYKLEVDEQAKTYNITIPFTPMGQTKSIATEEIVEIERSAYGWGNKPTHEGPTTTPGSVTPSSLKNPEAASLIAGGNLHHDKDLAFAPKDDIVLFDSGNVKMDASSTFLQNLPGAKDNVTIHLVYTLSKLPIN